MTRYVGLLRGVNLGKRCLAMGELREHLSALGAEQVETYIQSGNVVFSLAPQRINELEREFESSAKARFGFDIPWVLRTAEELEEVARSNPFLPAPSEDYDHKQHHVGFLKEAPDPRVVAALPASPSPPDDYAILGKEIYYYLPEGAARSELAQGRIFRPLKSTVTVRNWRTVLALLELAAPQGAP